MHSSEKPVAATRRVAGCTKWNTVAAKEQNESQCTFIIAHCNTAAAEAAT
jgi:hypothetical protein